MSVTLRLFASAKQAVIAGSQASVAGILMKRLGRSTNHHKPRASTAVRSAGHYLERPLPHGLVADDEAPCGQHLLDHARLSRKRK
jgi:hypothetical protein